MKTIQELKSENLELKLTMAGQRAMIEHLKFLITENKKIVEDLRYIVFEYNKMSGIEKDSPLKIVFKK